MGIDQSFKIKNSELKKGISRKAVPFLKCCEPAAVHADYLTCERQSLVISNIETVFLPLNTA
jgi:hypothetical protein